jgi:hypothetical protein
MENKTSPASPTPTREDDIKSIPLFASFNQSSYLDNAMAFFCSFLAPSISLFLVIFLFRLSLLLFLCSVFKCWCFLASLSYLFFFSFYTYFGEITSSILIALTTINIEKILRSILLA